MELDEPQIAEIDRQLTAFIRLTVARSEIRKVMGPAMAEVRAALAAHNVVPVGPMFTHHFKMDPNVFDFEVGLPVSAPVFGVGRVQNGELPGTKVARTTYRGSYEGLGEAWSEFTDWMIRNGQRPGENLWESYVAGLTPDESPVTQLNRPVL